MLALVGWAPSFAGAQAQLLPDAADATQSMATNAGGVRASLGGDTMDSVLEYVPQRFSQARRPDDTASKRRVKHHRPAFNVHAAAIRPRVGVSEGHVVHAAPSSHGVSRGPQIAADAQAASAADDWVSAASVGSAMDGGPNSPQIDTMAGRAQPAPHLAASVSQTQWIEGDVRAPQRHAVTATAASLERANATQAGNSPNGGSASHVTPPGDAEPDPWSAAWLEWSKSTHGQSARGASVTGQALDAASDSAIATTSLAHDASFDDWTRVGAARPPIATMDAQGVW
ncbi:MULTISPECIES: hypothetical protein [unclassified Caballeronia]|uniref:hypothetical protein n=1 Tax=unclassified Caballeronia TaxID=2646786 RepID=UPI00285A9CD5|nr:MULTISPECIES: hypothetical protein [unclassified Caballeronia]MDR5750731.1 hypothetical protein [Caballeronia sp. LZ024]MDR5842236.1 hypothetical protein [Caballeronia sp. LZ031]